MNKQELNKRIVGQSYSYFVGHYDTIEWDNFERTVNSSITKITEELKKTFKNVDITDTKIEFRDSLAILKLIYDRDVTENEEKIMKDDEERCRQIRFEQYIKLHMEFGNRPITLVTNLPDISEIPF